MERSKPHLVIGVDFGMTCTGVSYANLSIGPGYVKWIQKWPGRSQANENKVPTIVVYPNHTTGPSSWGFLSETASEQNKDYKEWFKTHLDPVRLAQAQEQDPQDAPRSVDEVEKYYTDYLHQLYRHIEIQLASHLEGATWQNAKIEFIFSVPTTWKPEIVERFRNIVQRAGFGSWPSHQVDIGLTEAEAAAVHTSVEASGIFKERDVLLVCDAGGGTTDLSVLRATEVTGETLSLEQLDVVYGDSIGSAAIDDGFEKLVMARLHEADQAHRLGISPEEAAWEMMKSKDFQNTKCEHGSPDDTPVFCVPIPRLDSNYVNHSVAIKNGEMRFSRDDLRDLFGNQIEKLIFLIDSQLRNMQKKFPNEQVAHLVLSGGLGHSPDVQRHLRDRYAFGNGHFNAQNMQIRIAPDPQLAVCKGIVADRVRKLKAGKAILKSRCCRASYGTLCKELYDEKRHVGRATAKDDLNGKLYVTKSIEWFIKQGQPVSSETPIIRNFTRKILPGDPRKTFPTQVVVSHVEKERLPEQLEPGAEILCEIASNLSTADERKFKRKNRHIWNSGKPYLMVDYQVKVLIGPADIRFELWFDGQKLNKDTPIKVEWTTTTAQVIEPQTPAWQVEDSIRNAASHKRSMDVRSAFQKSSTNLVNRPYELGNKSPPPSVGNLPNASGTLTPPMPNGLYPARSNPSGSQLNVNYNANSAWKSNSSVNMPDMSGLQIQDRY